MLTVKRYVILKARELAEYQTQDNIMQTLVNEPLSAQKIDQTSDLSNIVFIVALMPISYSVFSTRPSVTSPLIVVRLITRFIPT